MTDPTDYVMVPREALEYRNLPMKIAIAMEVGFALNTTTKAKAEAIAELLRQDLLSAAPPPPAREAGLREADLSDYGWAPGLYLFRCKCTPPDAKPMDWPMGAKKSWRCEKCARAALSQQETGVSPASDAGAGS